MSRWVPSCRNYGKVWRVTQNSANAAAKAKEDATSVRRACPGVAWRTSRRRSRRRNVNITWVVFSSTNWDSQRACRLTSGTSFGARSPAVASPPVGAGEGLPGSVLKLAPNTEAGLVLTKMADRNIAAALNLTMGLFQAGGTSSQVWNSGAWSYGPAADTGLPWPAPQGWNLAPLRESASRVLQPVDTFGTSIVAGSPTFTINPGTLTDGFVRVFIGTPAFAGAVTL